MIPCFIPPTPLGISLVGSHRICRQPSIKRRPSLNRYRILPTLSSDSPPPPPPPEDSDSAEHDIPKSSVDWNSEWSNFASAGMRSMAPKGREPVTKQQVAAARARGRVNDVTKNLPTRQQLFRDWRFWVAIIATLSIFSALVQSSSQGVGMA